MQKSCQLSALVQGLPRRSVTGGDAEIATLCCDSRTCTAGALFFALPGAKCDGQAFVDDALEKGAVALVLNQPPARSYSVPVVVVDNIRLVMAQIAQTFYHDPSADMLVIGITGTNGKTTTTYLLESILKSAGYRPAIFGTVEYRFGDLKQPASNTTPESLVLLKLLAAYREAGANALVLEVSSHALEQHRVDGIRLDVGVFTNLTPEHLDYHGDMDAYFASKARLFDQVPAHAGVVNLDDSYGVWLKEKHPDARGFSRLQSCAFHPLQLDADAAGVRGEIDLEGESVAICSPLVGEFNQSNILAAAGAARVAGITAEDIASGISSAHQVPGRMEKVDNSAGVLALVDYAHTSDALEKVLKALCGIEARRRITIVGCGGDRDPKKRPLMAATAVEYSDLAILTSDNPRTEDPLTILEQMRPGAISVGTEVSYAAALAGEQGFVVIPDRHEAIAFAASIARTGDLLLVAGKGHEDYQILGTDKVHFDDREELRDAFSVKQHGGLS